MTTKEERVLQMILKKAWSSRSFITLLVNNPIPVIEALTQHKISIPRGKKLIVSDQTNPNVLYLNIPPKELFEDIELSEKQLEKVAGGNSNLNTQILLFNNYHFTKSIQIK